MAVWLGVARSGGATALINTNLRGHSLQHCISIVSPKHVIVDARYADEVLAVAGGIDAGVSIWLYGAPAEGLHADWPRIDTALDAHDSTPLPADQRPELTIEDKCLYIYTSGTTGLPKAANINHYRVQAVMNGFSAATEACPCTTPPAAFWPRARC